ncbi:SpoIIE family protein phosphatase, partial [Streptomyces brasiliensis]|uniref:SpoIIE family protein phosphatase n=1 Tax=Streptomyces brasiliensis TaxID=1954 RepID=UPI001E3A2860
RGAYGVKRLCTVLNLSRSGFYRWLKTAPARAAKQAADAALTRRIRKAHAESGKTYGAKRITAELRAGGVVVNRKRVERLMRQHAIQGRTLKRRHRTAIPDPAAQAVPWIDQLGADFAAVVSPLSPLGEQPVGAWSVTYDSEHHWSPHERALISTLTDLAGQALKRIRLQQARIELATALQQTMLPTLPEHLPGLEVAARYRPSQDGLDIGGDWYDAFAMPDGAIALEIGDAQGHDVDAAAFMGQVSSSMRAIAAHEPDPGTVLTRTNDLLIAMGTARLASCTMLHIDPHDGQVTGTSAGHVPLLYAHKDGSHNVCELPGGPVLGVVSDTDYHGVTFTLDRDNALVMVTDGVVEGPSLTLDAGLELIGTLAGEALHDGLDAEATADRILDAAVAVGHIDDMAVLVIRRTG